MPIIIYTIPIDVRPLLTLSGNALSGHKDRSFSTKDADHDTWPSSCSQVFHGAWWYNHCHSSNLNGKYYQEGESVPYATGIVWGQLTGYYKSLKIVTMKMRPAGFTPGIGSVDSFVLRFLFYITLEKSISCTFDFSL